MSVNQESSIGLWKLYPSHLEVALFEVTMNVYICVCMYGYLQIWYIVFLAMAKTVSQTEGVGNMLWKWLTLNACFMAELFLPRKLIGHSLMFLVLLLQLPRRGEIGACLLRRSTSCRLGADSGAGEQFLYMTKACWSEVVVCHIHIDSLLSESNALLS